MGRSPFTVLKLPPNFSLRRLGDQTTGVVLVGRTIVVVCFAAEHAQEYVHERSGCLTVTALQTDSVKTIDSIPEKFSLCLPRRSWIPVLVV